MLLFAGGKGEALRFIPDRFEEDDDEVWGLEDKAAGGAAEAAMDDEDKSGGGGAVVTDDVGDVAQGAFLATGGGRPAGVVSRPLAG